MHVVQLVFLQDHFVVVQVVVLHACEDFPLTEVLMMQRQTPSRVNAVTGDSGVAITTGK